MDARHVAASGGWQSSRSAGLLWTKRRTSDRSVEKMARGRIGAKETVPKSEGVVSWRDARLQKPLEERSVVEDELKRL